MMKLLECVLEFVSQNSSWGCYSIYCLQVAHDRNICSQYFSSNPSSHSTVSWMLWTFIKYCHCYQLYVLKHQSLKILLYAPKNSLNATLKYQLVSNALWRRPAPHLKSTGTHCQHVSPVLQEYKKVVLVVNETGDPCSKQCSYLQIQKFKTF